jgi:hypothetical protein
MNPKPDIEELNRISANQFLNYKKKFRLLQDVCNREGLTFNPDWEGDVETFPIFTTGDNIEIFWGCYNSAKSLCEAKLNFGLENIVTKCKDLSDQSLVELLCIHPNSKHDTRIIQKSIPCKECESTEDKPSLIVRNPLGYYTREEI